MTTDTLLLVGRETGSARELYETHADRLRGRTGVDDAVVATYEREPAELRDRLALDADRVFAVPMTVAHDNDTAGGVAAALSALSCEVRYCEPPGLSPAVTDAVVDRAAGGVPAEPDATLVLVGFGSSSKPYGRLTADYHAERLRERTDYADVVTCYVLQNPAVECARYNVATDRAVAVPLFVDPCEATEREIPAALELDRGGIAYTDPLGDHPRLTDAIHAEVARERALARSETEPTVSLVETRRPLAADGDGRPE